jgi:hypothetical protein
MKKYLAAQLCVPSLYVPDTASKNKNSYKKFVKITKDANWIGLYIWQHMTGAECDFKPGFQCMGCTEAGTAREVKEGKQYSSNVYHRTEQNGKENIRDAPGGRFEIHNGGGKMYDGKPTISTVTELCLDDDNRRYLFTTAQLENYVNQINKIIAKIPSGIPLSLQYVRKGACKRKKIDTKKLLF